MFENRSILQVKATGERMVIHSEDLAYHLTQELALTENDVVVLPITDITADELATLLGDAMENANYHSLTSLAEDVLTALQEQKFSEVQQLQVIAAIASALEPLM